MQPGPLGRGAQDDDDSDDENFIPPPTTATDERPNKRARCTVNPKDPVENDVGATKAARDTLWASFQASVTSPSPGATLSPPSRMVTVEIRHRFAGKEVVELKEVPEKSEDARKWPRWNDPDPSIAKAAQDADQQFSPTNQGAATSTKMSSKVDAATAGTSSVPPVGSLSTASLPSLASTASLPKPKPGPRRSKLSLSSLPTPGSNKPKKLSTLDKSALDWQSHVTSGEPKDQDELTANRRGSGYLDKVDFLQRVEERKNEAFETVRGKRRRG